ncbi:hypothetical protein [Brucella endophytica]|uniref:hypothetical protein n=1 Tax=Brucella endophytica TaxID=1963359 RepID=UPI001669A0D2|nr:hypothetical protein [Brucella endophytica]
MTDGSIPGGSTVTISGQNFRCSQPTQNIAPTGGQNGVATFLIGVDADASSVSVAASTTIQGVVAPPPNNYQSIGTAKAAMLGLSKHYVPLAPDDSQLPSADEYTTVATTVVMTGDNPPQAVPGYTIDWYQAGSGGDIGLFDSRVRTFLEIDAQEPLTPSDPRMILSDNKMGYFIRSTTDDQGYARLYLVSKKDTWGTDSNIPKGIGVCGTLQAYLYFDNPSPAGTFVTVDLTKDNVQLQGDTIQVEYLDAGSAVLNYPDITTGDLVPVHIPQNYKNANDTDVYVTVINGIATAVGNTDTSGNGPHWNSHFPKADGYSDEGENANVPNQLQFVVGTQTGEAHASQQLTFQGTGSRGTDEPPAPSDNAPSSPVLLNQEKDYPNTINSQVINNPVTFQISLDKNQTGGWGTPQIGDQITLTAYLHGWEDGTNNKKTAQVSPPLPYTIDNIDQTNGYVQIALDNTRFKGFGKAGYPSYTKGWCDVAYSVSRATVALPYYSNMSHFILSTVPPSKDDEGLIIG